MNRDDITRMAREAGFNEFSDGLRDDGTRDTYLDCWPEQLEHFAALVAAAEREACAKVCEGTTAFVPFQSEDCYRFAHKAAAVIRARGEQ